MTRYRFIGDNSEARVNELVLKAAGILGKVKALDDTLLNITLQTLANDIAPFVDPPCATCVALKDKLRGVVPDKTIERAMKEEHKFQYAVDNGKKAGPKNKARSAAKSAAETEFAETVVPLDRLDEIQDVAKTSRKCFTIISENGFYVGAFADCEISVESHQKTGNFEQPQAMDLQPMLPNEDLQLTTRSGVFIVHGGKCDGGDNDNSLL